MKTRKTRKGEKRAAVAPSNKEDNDRSAGSLYLVGEETLEVRVALHLVAQLVLLDLLKNLTGKGSKAWM
jgi:hypothetical protein